MKVFKLPDEVIDAFKKANDLQLKAQVLTSQANEIRGEGYRILHSKYGSQVAKRLKFNDTLEYDVLDD